MVAAEDIVRICDPEASWSLVRVEETPRATDIEDQIVFNQVLSLSCVFDEDCVAHRVVGYIALHSQIVHAMDRHSSVERMMDRVLSHV